jgi:signal transduction histidine kinase
MWKRLIPDTIATRTLLVLIVGLSISHAVSVVMYLTDRTSSLMFTGGEHVSERIVTISRLVESASPNERQSIIELANQPNLHVSWSQESPIEDASDSGWKADVLRDAVTSHLNVDGSRHFRFRYGELTDTTAQIDGPAFFVSVQLPDLSWLNFIASVEPPNLFWSFRFGLSMAVMLLAVVAFSVIVVRHLVKPITVFAQAANRLGVDVKAPPVPETGPAEVRQAARAFNEMQDRIRRFVEDRTQMVAAISHDLGTPITRLRLRAEFVEDEEQQKKMLADLDDMERMVASALSFARDDAACEPRAIVDLRTLLQRVCDDVSDAGHEVAIATGDTAVPYGCRPGALRRALANLIENAVKYGQRARVALDDGLTAAVITVDDDGPGISKVLQEEAFKPFRRLEASRSRETGGTGLGLTMARTIIRAHGGEITLANRPEGGLRVEIALPR